MVSIIREQFSSLVGRFLSSETFDPGATKAALLGHVSRLLFLSSLGKLLTLVIVVR